MNQVEPNECTLRFAVDGTAERCPRDRWPDLATYVLETRERLEAARDLAEAERAHAEFRSAAAVSSKGGV